MPKASKYEKGSIQYILQFGSTSTGEEGGKGRDGFASGRAFLHTSDQPLFLLFQQIVDSLHELQQSLWILLLSGLIAKLLPFFENFSLHAASRVPPSTLYSIPRNSASSARIGLTLETFRQPRNPYAGSRSGFSPTPGSSPEAVKGNRI